MLHCELTWTPRLFRRPPQLDRILQLKKARVGRGLEVPSAAVLTANAGTGAGAGVGTGGGAGAGAGAASGAGGASASATASTDGGIPTSSGSYNEDGYRSSVLPVDAVEPQAMYFMGLGSAPTVPVYLRILGPVRNLHLTKRDVELAVREVWMYKRQMESMPWTDVPSTDAKDTGGASQAARPAAPSDAAAAAAAADAASKPDTSTSTLGATRRRRGITMGDAMYAYLLDRFGTPGMAVEYAYNVLDGAERFEYDADLEMFLKVLSGDIGEVVYHQSLLAVGRLCDQLTLVDRQFHGGMTTGQLPKATFISKLGKVVCNCWLLLFVVLVVDVKRCY